MKEYILLHFDETLCRIHVDKEGYLHLIMSDGVEFRSVGKTRVSDVISVLIDENPEIEYARIPIRNRKEKDSTNVLNLWVYSYPRSRRLHPRLYITDVVKDENLYAIYPDTIIRRMTRRGFDVKDCIVYQNFMDYDPESDLSPKEQYIANRRKREEDINSDH